MAKKLIRAAGAVVLREARGGREVLVVHRPRYDDWSLPKGKLDAGESAAAAAVREVAEETGVRIRLGAPLDRTRYRIGDGRKEVDWWVGVVADEAADADTAHIDQDEVDEVAWWPVARALSELTQDTDRSLVTQALDKPGTTPLMVVRHGKAIDRKSWGSDEDSRPLNPRGQRQADELVGLFTAYDIERITSSPWGRCMQTVTPYATATARVVEPIAAMTEDAFEAAPHEVASATATLAERAAAGLSTMICGHRPVLPCIFDALEVPDRSLEVGEVVVLHLSADGEVHAVEVHGTDA